MRTNRYRRGSSPRAWGILLRWCHDQPCCRFIPTCVGNTFGCGDRQRRCSVHPHVRGEYGTITVEGTITSGSSPRAWGIPLSQQGEAWRDRFIPTCVGNTPHWPQPRGSSPVHPHVRGEYCRAIPRRPSPTGSSPRAWGIHQRHQPALCVPRFIPTCVGNTRSRVTTSS